MRQKTSDPAVTRKEQIIAVATEKFLEKGFSATSMNDVAQASSLHKASLYHHFPSKEALFLAVIDAGFPEQIEKLRRLHREDGGDYKLRLSAAFDAIYDAIVLSPMGRMAPLIAETSRLMPGVARSFYDTFIQTMHEETLGLVADGIRAGVFEPVDLEGLDHLIFSPPVSLALSRAMFHRFDDLAFTLDVNRTKSVHLALVLKLLAAE